MEKKFRKIWTHSHPDMDAIGFAWLMKRFAPGFAEAVIKLMPFSRLDQEALSAADAVGDMGGVYDPARWRFDHHHLPGSESVVTCAAKMCWEALVALGLDVDHLEPLIEEVLRGDQGHTSRLGIHALLWGTGVRKNPLTGQRLSDEEMLAAGFDLLDRAAAWLKREVEVQAELDEKVVWKSKDGYIWAIANGSAGSGFAAYERGARVVVFQGEPIELPEGVSYPLGASRSPEWQEPHLGELVDKILGGEFSELEAELSLWFKHNAGFFVGRGTSKSPKFKPPQAGLIEIAQALNSVWRRSMECPVEEELVWGGNS